MKYQPKKFLRYITLYGPYRAKDMKSIQHKKGEVYGGYKVLGTKKRFKWTVKWLCICTLCNKTKTWIASPMLFQQISKMCRTCWLNKNHKMLVCIVCLTYKDDRCFDNSSMDYSKDGKQIYCRVCRKLTLKQKCKKSKLYHEFLNSRRKYWATNPTTIQKNKTSRSMLVLKRKAICYLAYGAKCLKCGSDAPENFHHPNKTGGEIARKNGSQYKLLIDKGFPGADGNYKSKYAVMLLCVTCHLKEHKK